MRPASTSLEQELRELFARRPELVGSGGVRADKLLLDTAAQVDRMLREGAEGDREADAFLARHPILREPELPVGAAVACPGVRGAFTHLALRKLFREPQTLFIEEFDGVLEAVQQGRVRFGVLPVENSSAGPVSQTLDLVARHALYISRTTSLKVEHFFCAHPDTDPGSIRRVTSHPQALAQCEGFRRSRGLEPVPYSNTSTAAQWVRDHPGEPVGCICSRYSAEIYGLVVLEEQVQDFDENYTRFICVSRDNLVLPGANSISLSLSFANEPGALMNLLTRFAACRLNLSKIVSMPIASRDFLVRFHLDFTGSILERPVAALLGSLGGEYASLHYLGNYDEV